MAAFISIDIIGRVPFSRFYMDRDQVGVNNNKKNKADIQPS